MFLLYKHLRVAEGWGNLAQAFAAWNATDRCAQPRLLMIWT